MLRLYAYVELIGISLCFLELNIFNRAVCLMHDICKRLNTHHTKNKQF